MQAPSLGLKILSCFDASLKMLLPALGHEVKFDNSKVIITIDNRGELLTLENIKGASKNAKIYVGRSWIVHNRLFCVNCYARVTLSKHFSFHLLVTML